MKHYLRFMTNFVFLIFSFGYILPLLISIPDTMLVLLGVLYGIIVVPGVLFYFNRSYISSVINSFKEKI